MNFLFVCTGNTCRSPMAEGFFRHFFPEHKCRSAGINPEQIVNKFTVKVMSEKGIDISGHIPESVNCFMGINFDAIITLSDEAGEFFRKPASGNHNILHINVEDPAIANGTESYITGIYRATRDKISEEILKYFGDSGSVFSL